MGLLASIICILVIVTFVCVFGSSDRQTAMRVLEGSFINAFVPEAPEPANVQAPRKEALGYHSLTKVDRTKSSPRVRTNGGVKRAYISPYTKKLIASRQRWRCAVCNRLLDASYEIDHIIPLHRAAGAHGGSSSDSTLQSLENSQALCRSPCHIEKTARENSARSRLN